MATAAAAARTAARIARRGFVRPHRGGARIIDDPPNAKIPLQNRCSAAAAAVRWTTSHGRGVSSEKSSSSSSSSEPPAPAAPMFHPSNQTYLVFGANTDVGKTIVSAGLVRASLRGLGLESSSSPDGNDLLGRRGRYVHYVKPLQCGGSDEEFVERHAAGGGNVSSDDEASDDDEMAEMPGGGGHGYFVPGLMCTTLFEWDTPASPHVSSRLEDAPASDDEVISAVRETLNLTGDAALTVVETAGGVMSPSSASPLNAEAWHSRGEDQASSSSSWGWCTQADLYSPPFSRLNLPAVLVGDGRLGGISVTLSSLEALEARGYAVHSLVLIDDGHFGSDNARALEEYIASAEGRRERRRRLLLGDDGDDNRIGGIEQDGQISVHLLPAVPPMPEPLHGWFATQEVEETFQNINDVFNDRWRRR